MIRWRIMTILSKPVDEISWEVERYGNLEMFSCNCHHWCCQGWLISACWSRDLGRTWICWYIEPSWVLKSFVAPPRGCDGWSFFYSPPRRIYERGCPSVCLWQKSQTTLVVSETRCQIFLDIFGFWILDFEFFFEVQFWISFDFELELEVNLNWEFNLNFNLNWTWTWIELKVESSAIIH